MSDLAKNFREWARDCKERSAHFVPVHYNTLLAAADEIERLDVKQEEVANKRCMEWGCGYTCSAPEAQPLTDEEISTLWWGYHPESAAGSQIVWFARAVLKAQKEKT